MSMRVLVATIGNWTRAQADYVRLCWAPEMEEEVQLVVQYAKDVRISLTCEVWPGVWTEVKRCVNRGAIRGA